MYFPKGTIIRHNDSRNEYESDGKGGWTFLSDGRYFAPGAWVTKPLRDPAIIEECFTIVKDTTPDRLAELEARVKMLEEVVEKLVAGTQEVAKAEEGFKVGDRVRINTPEEPDLDGKCGTLIRKALVSDYDWTVRGEGGNGTPFQHVFKESELEHA